MRRTSLIAASRKTRSSCAAVDEDPSSMAGFVPIVDGGGSSIVMPNLYLHRRRGGQRREGGRKHICQDIWRFLKKMHFAGREGVCEGQQRC